MNIMRTVKKILSDETEEDIPFENLKKGDVFKLFEPDGTPVLTLSGESILTADGDAIPTEKYAKGNYSIVVRL